MAIHYLNMSFNAGELSPQLSARVAVEKYQAGCRILRNFIPHVHGPVFKRPGTEYLGDTFSHGAKSRLIGFNFSTTTSFMIELGAGIFRIWSNGVLVPLQSPLTNNYQESEIFEVQVVQINDVMYLTHEKHAPHKLSRLADDNWTFAEVEWKWPAVRDENVTAMTITPSATTGTGISLTASGDVFDPLDVGGYYQIAHRRRSALVEFVGAVGSFSGSSDTLRVLGRWDFYSYGKWSGDVHLEIQTEAGTWQALRSWKGNKDRNVVANGTQESESLLRITVENGDGEAASDAAVPRFVLEAADSKVFGLCKVTAVTDAQNATADVVKDLLNTDATEFWTEGAWSDRRGFPRAVVLHDQRLMFGGCEAQPQTIWGSVIADFENFQRSTLADGSFAFTLAAQESNVIQWLASQGALLIGTSGDEWNMGNNTDTTPISATQTHAKRQSKYGSAYIGAQIVQDVAIFVQRNSKKMRQFSYSAATESYGAAELTVLAQHITEAGIVQTAYQGQKDSILWAVTGDGQLVGMTFENSQNVFAWHRHDTMGDIESVATIYGEGSDEVWMVVKRTIEGQTRRYMERFHPRTLQQDFSDQTALVYADSSLTFEGDGIEVIDGLDHLEGEQVSILADGAQQEPKRVTNFAITVDPPADKVIVGLPYISQVQPMRPEIQVGDGTSRGRRFNMQRATIEVLDSLGGVARSAPGMEPERLVFRESQHEMDAPPPLLSGEVDAYLESTHEESVDFIIEHFEPLPFNLVSLVLKFDVYGN